MIVPTKINPGEFVFEKFKSGVRKQELVEWNYRDTSGKLHTGIAKTVPEAELKAYEFGYQIKFENIPEECVE